ncbi:DUF6355 family natural product biosynthesis protein [Streptomyces sp. NBC_01622]|uniref:DUF6355 family natural product biosynthesis protein n=1 Tax=Streptomyces sp. NBC_01622 TaxID=2975903 RepID=UPI00386998BE|nr:DUF6355 family natural product biosynthesis protein [Streptomyces sp. NBC_01622]
MRVRRVVTSALGAAALVLTSLGTVAAATPGSAGPCGFYKTSTDAYYRHCTTDGSHVVIKVRVARARDHEACVRPGTTWLGSARKIQGAYYVGRTC